MGHTLSCLSGFSYSFKSCYEGRGGAPGPGTVPRPSCAVAMRALLRNQVAKALTKVWTASPLASDFAQLSAALLCESKSVECEGRAVGGWVPILRCLGSCHLLAH